MIYLVQVSCCWILFYAVYRIFLDKETFFSINRYYLLGSLALGLAIPLLASLLPSNTTSTEIYFAMAQLVEIQSEAQITELATSKFTWLQALNALYYIGLTIGLLKLLWGLVKIYNIYSRAVITKYDNYLIATTNHVHLPFSFFSCVFISKKLPLTSKLKTILRHEELHVSQWHSIDIIALEVLHILFWFNPVLILTR